MKLINFLLVASTAPMATAFTPCWMTISTGLAAIALTLFLDGAIEIHNTKTRFTGTLHLGHSYHGLNLQGIFLNS